MSCQTYGSLKAAVCGLSGLGWSRVSWDEAGSTGIRQTGKFGEHLEQDPREFSYSYSSACYLCKISTCLMIALLFLYCLS